MAAAADTYVETHFKKRLQSLVRWALRMALPHHEDMTPKVFGRKLHSLVVWVTGERDEDDVVAALRAKMDELGLRGFDAVEPLCCTVLDWELALGRRATIEDKRLRLLEMHRSYVHTNRRRYEEICR